MYHEMLVDIALWIVVSVWIELESMSVCRNKESNSLQTLGSSLKKNERKKDKERSIRKKNELICVSNKGEKGFSLFWWRTVKVLYFLIKKLYLKFKKMNDTFKTKKHVSTVLDKECDTVENCVDVWKRERSYHWPSAYVRV